MSSLRVAQCLVSRVVQCLVTGWLPQGLVSGGSVSSLWVVQCLVTGWLPQYLVSDGSVLVTGWLPQCLSHMVVTSVS